MIGVLWNCRGVSKKGMSTMLKDILRDQEVDFVGLQETMRKHYPDKFFRKIDYGKNFAWHWIPSNGKSGGILCGVNLDRFEVLKFIEGSFSVNAIVQDKKTKRTLSLVTVYGPAHEEKREYFLTELSQICSSKKHPMLLGGDFNILRFSSDKNKSFIGNKATDLFNWVINTHELRDLPLNGGNYTWSNNQQLPTLERLDRILISEDWEQLFPLTSLRRLPRELSDHNPLLLCTDQPNLKRSKAFSFETSWLKHHDFVPKVKEIWKENIISKSAVDRWCIKMNRLKKFLKGWGLSLKGHNKKYKKCLREELIALEKLEEENPLPAHLLERKNFILSENNRLLEEEELYWHKRSNNKWLLEGDLNTGFFQRVANGKKRKNTIFSMQKDGMEIEETEKILDLATNYYKDLFGKSANVDIKLNQDCWVSNEKVSQSECENLCRKFELEEIKQAIFNMEKNTAPGPDHMPVEFFQVCWDIIKEDLLEMFEEFYENKLDISRLNYGVITLIPKLKEANQIQQYRPICLLNVVFKIFSKTLMMRVESVLERIISKGQTAFLKGRSIMEGTMSLHEVIHDTKVKKKDGLVLKLDFEKAYDKISWKFLFECLSQRGFPEKWCIWIKEVVTSGTLSVKVNDMVGPYFTSGKGVRQGDPLSPLLFNIAADALAKMIQMGQQNQLIKGLIPEFIEGGLALLQYADDTILCIQDDMEIAQNLKLLLYLYENMSGLKINFNKSEIIMISQDNEKSLNYAEMFNCSIGSWPIKYLGVPVSGNRIQVSNWIPLVEKIEKRLDGWKGGALSLGGRLTLLNACLSSIPIYSMSMYLLPKTILKKIDVIRKRFFWQGGKAKKISLG